MFEASCKGQKVLVGRLPRHGGMNQETGQRIADFAQMSGFPALDARQVGRINPQQPCEILCGKSRVLAQIA